MNIFKLPWPRDIDVSVNVAGRSMVGMGAILMGQGIVLSGWTYATVMTGCLMAVTALLLADVTFSPVKQK